MPSNFVNSRLFTKTTTAISDMCSWLIISCCITTSFLPLCSANAQDYDTEIAAKSFKSGSPAIFSKNGNSYAIKDATGQWQVVRNAFQFDETIHPLPIQFLDTQILAVSYYGSAFGFRKNDEGCSIVVYTAKDQLLGPFLVSPVKDCSIPSGAANVTEVLAFAVHTDSASRLLLLRAGAIEEVWNSSTHVGNTPKLEGFALNDLNTVGFTISTLQKGRKQFSSSFWVPARGVNPLILPKAASKRAIIKDVNNRNTYLLSTQGGVAVYDPAKKRVSQLRASASRLTSNGSPFTSSTLFSTDGTRTVASCFSTGGLSGHKVEFAAINDERELMLLGTAPAGVKIAKVIPFTVKGYPKCTVKRSVKGR